MDRFGRDYRRSQSPEERTRRRSQSPKKSSDAHLSALMANSELYASQQPMAFSRFVALAGPDADPALVDERYEQYKTQFYRNSVRMFFDAHRSDAWFLERYHPVHQESVRRETRDRVHKNHALFIEDLKSGLADSLSLDAPDSSSATDEVVATDPQQQAAMDTETAPAVGKKSYTIDFPARTPSAETTLEQIHTRARTLYVGLIPADLTRDQLRKVFESDPDFDNLILCSPQPSRGFRREALVLLRDGSDPMEFIRRYDGMEIGKFELRLAPDAFAIRPVKYAPSVSSTEQRLRHDFEQVCALVKHFDALYELNAEALAEHVPMAVSAQDLSVDELKKALDIYLTYLRRVFWYCYYNAPRHLTQSAEDMFRTCPERYLRASEGDKSHEDSEWAKRVDDAFQLITQPINYTLLQKYGHTSSEDVVEKWNVEHILKVDEQKYRCLVPECGKLFKGEDFLRKHFNNKHGEIVKHVEQEAQFFANYIEDPMRYSLADQPPAASSIAAVASLSASTLAPPEQPRNRGYRDYHPRDSYRHQSGHDRGGRRDRYQSRRDDRRYVDHDRVARHETAISYE